MVGDETMVKCNTRYLRILGIDVLSLPEVSEFTKSQANGEQNKPVSGEGVQ